MCSLHRRSEIAVSDRPNNRNSSKSRSYSKALLQNLPQLLRHGIAGVLDRQVASLRSNLLGGKRPLGEPPSRLRPPLLELLDLLLVVLIFCVVGDTHVGQW